MLLVMDATTASGMGVGFVANHIFDTTSFPVSELNIGDMKATFAMYLRILFAPLYFKIMEFRANKEWRTAKKSR